MRSFLKVLLLNTLALALVAHISPGVTYQNNLSVLLITALVLALANAIVLPFLKVLFIPINIISLGLLGWFVHVIILYGVTLLVAGFQIEAFTLNVLDTSIVLSTFWAFVVVTLMLNITTSIINWIVR